MEMRLYLVTDNGLRQPRVNVAQQGVLDGLLKKEALYASPSRHDNIKALPPMYQTPVFTT